MLLNHRSLLVAAVAAAALVLAAAPAFAEDDEKDIYVAPLDESGSDEQLREDASSGFDTPGPFYINEDDYDAGARDDGTWSPDVPDPSEPEPADADEGN